MSQTDVRHDRRRYPRRPIRLAIELERLDEQGLVGCVSKDVSLGGTRVEASAPLDGSVFVVMAAGGRVFATAAEVLEVSSAGSSSTEMRLRFTHRSDETFAAFARFLESVGP